MEIQRLHWLSEKRFALLFGLIAASFLVYETLRAIRVPLTFDEAATHMTYLSSSVWAVFDLNSANNHFLYSLLAKLGCVLAGSSELVLRLPSLLGYLLYLGSSWAILNRFFDRFLALAGFLFLNVNPYILDYFAMGRGYGLALGLETAAVYFFLVFLDPKRTAPDERHRALASSLALAFASALANFVFLNLLIGLWVFAAVFFLAQNRVGDLQPSPAPPGRSGASPSRLFLAAAALSVPFNLIVIGQYLRLSEKSIDPVAVRVRGSQAEEIHDLRISGIELYSNDIPFTLQDGAWVPPRSIYLKRLMLGFSQASLDRVQEVDVEIGARKLRFDLPEIRRWRHGQEADFQYFIFDPSLAGGKSFFRDMSGVINWRGDRDFFRAFGREAVRLFGALAFILGLIFGLSRLAVRGGLLQLSQIRPLSSSAGLAALYFLYPIYSLSQNQALYFGGENGFFKDSFSSLIWESFYGAAYAAEGRRVVVFLMLGCAAIALLWLGWRLQKKAFFEHPETFVILAVVTIISLLSNSQRAIFRIPNLMGRTAIFFIPLLTLFPLFLLRDGWRLGGVRRTFAAVLLIAVVGLSFYHWFRTANLTHVQDFRADADTRSMIQDVASLRAGWLSSRSRVRLGVDWVFWPSSVYYQRRDGLSWLDVYILPTPWNCDVDYLSFDNPKIGSMAILKRYPQTGNVLVR